MGKPKAPKTPDYAAAAREQGIANFEAARATGRMNNPNVISPYGTQTTVWNGDQPTVTQEFSPDQQRLYDTNQITQENLGRLGNTGSAALGDVIGKNLDMSSITAQPGNYDDTRQKVIDAMMGRYDIGGKQAEEQKNSDLVAAGIRPGTEAYDREMQRLDMARNDYRNTAETSAASQVQQGFSQDSALRQQQMAEMLAQRQTPLNEITALMSGSQVSNPFAQAAAYNGGATAAPTPIMQGAQAQGQADMAAYNARTGAYGNMMSGLFGLGGAAMGTGGITGLFSDRRLKKNVVRIGTHSLGIAKYLWTYLWGEVATGVMADELEKVMPEAVGMRGGYKTVNYAMIGE